MTPNSGLNYAVESDAVPDEEQHVGRALDRSIVLHPGTYVVKVQCAVNNANSVCYLSNWNLNVMRLRRGQRPQSTITNTDGAGLAQFAAGLSVSVG